MRLRGTLELWQNGTPVSRVYCPGKIHGGVGIAGGPQSSIAAAFKGKGKHKGESPWKWNGKGCGKGYGKGFGNGNGKKSLNMATDAEYNAAWYDDQWHGHEDDWEGDDYNNGYNYAMINNNGGRHYSMMSKTTTSPITIGPKFFPIELNDEHEEDEMEEVQRSSEPNSKCKIELKNGHSTTTTQTNNKSWVDKHKQQKSGGQWTMHAYWRRQSSTTTIIDTTNT